MMNVDMEKPKVNTKRKSQYMKCVITKQTETITIIGTTSFSKTRFKYAFNDNPVARFISITLKIVAIISIPM